MKIYAGRKQIKKEIGSYKRVKSGGEARMNTGKKKERQKRKFSSGKSTMNIVE